MSHIFYEGGKKIVYIGGDKIEPPKKLRCYGRQGRHDCAKVYIQNLQQLQIRFYESEMQNLVIESTKIP